MASFEIMIWIYNHSLKLMVTPLDAKFFRFKVDAAASGNGVAILKYSDDGFWLAEQVGLKCFTAAYIHQVGKLIEMHKPELFCTGIA